MGEQFAIPVCVLNSELPNVTRCHGVDKDKANSKRSKDQESGASRGIDFQFVSNVINFDFPRDVDSYIHRVGRTARGTAKGTALSLTSMKEMERVTMVEDVLKLSRSSGTALNENGREEDHSVFKPYRFRMEELDGFRYRAVDAWRAVTKIAIREARLKEIKAEMLNSVKLKTHLADNPRDVQILRHDKA